MNLIRTSRNIFKSSKLNAKGGGGLPHYDPPDMKRVQNKRFFSLHDHLLWFKDSVEQQYYVILKHNQYRGLSGMLSNIFRYYLLGTVGVVLTVIVLKSLAHDTKNYYYATMIGSKGSPLYDNHVNAGAKMEMLRGLVAENRGKDFLGRRSADYYHIPGTLKTKLNRLTPLEKKLEAMDQTSPGGRGSA